MNRKGMVDARTLIFTLALLLLVMAILIGAFVIPFINESKNLSKCELHGGECKGACEDGESGIYAPECFKNNYEQCCIPENKSDNVDIDDINTSDDDDPDTDGNDGAAQTVVPGNHEIFRVTENGNLNMEGTHVLLYDYEYELLIKRTGGSDGFQCNTMLRYKDGSVEEPIIFVQNHDCKTGTTINFKPGVDHKNKYFQVRTEVYKLDGEGFINPAKIWQFQVK